MGHRNTIYCEGNFLVCDKFNSIRYIDFIVFSLFIQNNAKGGTTSAKAQYVKPDCVSAARSHFPAQGFSCSLV
jgi:hypothetical protein